jgi:hypothetical protein
MFTPSSTRKMKSVCSSGNLVPACKRTGVTTQKVTGD